MTQEYERRYSRSKWHQAAVIPEMTATLTSNNANGGTWAGGYSGGTPWNPNTTTPYTPNGAPITQPWTNPPVVPATTQTIQYLHTNLPDEEETDECADGHYIDHASIRTIIEDGEDQITGRCLFCEVVIYIPDIEGALSFERAGKAVGRAMTLGDGDDEKVGDLLADVLNIERALKIEMKKFERALKMLDIARDLVEQRACA